MEGNRNRGMLTEGEEVRAYRQLTSGTNPPESPQEEERSQQSPSRARRWFKVINTPVVILLLTAVFGVSIGAWFQDRAFRKNTLFEAELDQVISGRNESIRMLQDLDTELKLLSATEEVAQVDAEYCKPSIFIPIVERLKLYDTRSMALEDYAASVGENNVVNSSLTSFRERLADLLVCLNNYLEEKPTCTPCTEQHTKLQDATRAVIKAHNTLVTDQIRKNK